jgi:serine/threonine-protein kinase RsbW
MARQESEVRISIESRFENIELIDVVAEAALKHLGASRETAENAALAVREAVANGVLHGNRLQADRRVEVAMELFEDEVEITVTDEGQGFDPKAVPDPLAAENLLKPSGRGIFLMRTLMDHVEFSFNGSTGRGTLVRLRKRLKSADETAGAEDGG